MSKKVAIIGDTHFARRAEDPIIKKKIKEGQIAFFEYLVPKLKELGVDTILFTGDIHDTRNSINVEALVQTRELFKTKLADFNKHIVLGNHDLYYDTTYDVSSLQLFQDIPNLTLHLKSIAKIELLGKTWYMVPWVIPDNEEKMVKFLENLAKKPTDNNVILGHFDMMGIVMEAGNQSVAGFDPNLFLSAAKLTISGHFHSKSMTDKLGNKILYTGTPYPLTFANSDDEHGIWIVDEELNLEFIQNPISPTFTTIHDTDDFDNLPDYSNTFVRFFFDKNKSPEELSTLKMKLEAKKPLTVKSLPYKDLKADIVKHNGMEMEANNLLHMDPYLITEVYVTANENILPEVKFYKNVKDEILNRSKNYLESINK